MEIMKPTGAIPVLILIVIFSLCACGKKTPDVKTVSETETLSETETPTEALRADKNDFKWIAREITGLSASGAMKKKIIIPKSCERVNNGAFKGVESIKTVIFEGTDTKIGSMAFAGCKNLKKITLPANLETIPENLFEDCVRLKKIKIPQKTVEIKSKAFAGCKSLKHVLELNAYVKIEPNAFTGCESLRMDNLSLRQLYGFVMETEEAETQTRPRVYVIGPEEK